MDPFDQADMSKIDAYLDGVLAPAERDYFSRMLSASAPMQAVVDLQKRIDHSLALRFAPPCIPQDLVEQLCGSGLREAVANPQRRSWLKLATVAAAATVVWAILGWSFFFNRSEQRHYSSKLPFETIYQTCVADGFRPKWVCEDKLEFASTFRARQGQALLLADLPAGTKMEGLTYCGGLSRYTTTMLARVDGLPVMVFVDRASCDSHPSLSGETNLHLFRTELGLLVLYEITPFNRPRVSMSLHLADTPLP